MKQKELDFVRRRFRDYYAGRGVQPPTDLSSREFGFGIVDKIDFRHKAFVNETELREYFLRDTPLFASYSAVHYQFPANRPMERKNARVWDLVFDIDEPSIVEKHEHDSVFCEKCFKQVKEDVVRLVEEFLEKDFGFSRGDASVNFSGSKGFHVHVESSVAQELSQDARKQLVAFVKGPKADHLLIEQKTRELKKPLLSGPSLSERGWPRKVFVSVRAFLEDATVEQLVELGLRKDRAKKVLENKELILQKMEEGNWGAVYGTEKLFEKLVAKVVAKHALVVDDRVTFDRARLIRLPGTLHGGTGFEAKKLSLADVPKFSPLADAVAFKSKNVVRVKASNDFELEFLGETTRVKKGENGLREGLAVLLLCKNKAVLVQ